MNVGKAIITALSSLKLPVYQTQYTGTDKTYFVFNIGTVPADFADDLPQHERASIQLHLFCPVATNTTSLRDQVKQLLTEAGFDYPSLVDASDEDGQHVVWQTGCGYGSV